MFKGLIDRALEFKSTITEHDGKIQEKGNSFIEKLYEFTGFPYKSKDSSLSDLAKPPTILPSIPKYPDIPNQSYIPEFLSYKPEQFDNYTKEFNLLLTDDMYDGFRLEAVKSVTPHMQANQSLFIGTSLRDTGYLYQFGPTFSLNDGQTLLMARYANDGTMSFRGAHKLNNAIDYKLTVSSSLTSEQRNLIEGGVNLVQDTWAASAKAAWQGMLITTLGHSQLLTPNLHMGAEMTWLGSTQATTGSIGFRHEHKSHVVSGILTRQPNFKNRDLTESMHIGKLTYFRKVSERLSLGTELEITQEKSQIDSALRVAYEYIFRHARIQGTVNAGGNVSMIARTASGFGVSANADFWKNDYKFGFMMQIVSQNPQTVQDNPSFI